MANERLARTFDRDTINLEPYQLIWFDTNMNKTGNDTTVVLTRMREVVDYTRLFVDFEECLHFIKKTEDTKTFFICSSNHDKVLLSQINDLKNVCTIYILCQNREQYENLPTQCSKVILFILKNLFL